MIRVISTTVFFMLLYFNVMGSENDRFFAIYSEKACLIEAESSEIQCEIPLEMDKNIGVIVSENKWCIKDEISGTCDMENDVVYEDEAVLILRKSFGDRQGISSILNIYKSDKVFAWNEIHFNQRSKETEYSVKYGTFN